MCRPKSNWEISTEFHGHECLGLAIGFRQALLALEFLGVKRAKDEELLAIVETDACGVDAVQVLTGCTLGKGNLIYKDAGKQALTLANRRTGKAVRIVLKPDAISEDEKFSALRSKIAANTASEKEKAEWDEVQKERVKSFLNAPSEKLFRIKEVEMPPIERARLFKTVVCSKCREPFAETKARLADGQIVCGDCYKDYSRGW